MHYIKKTSNKSRLELNFVQKSQQAHMPISTNPWWSWARKINMVEILHFNKLANYIQFWAERCQNYQ